MAVIAIAGATGTLGRSVCELARTKGHEVRELSRSCGARRGSRAARGARAVSGH